MPGRADVDRRTWICRVDWVRYFLPPDCAGCARFFGEAAPCVRSCGPRCRHRMRRGGCDKRPRWPLSRARGQLSAASVRTKRFLVWDPCASAPRGPPSSRASARRLLLRRDLRLGRRRLAWLGTSASPLRCRRLGVVGGPRPSCPGPRRVRRCRLRRGRSGPTGASGAGPRCRWSSPQTGVSGDAARDGPGRRSCGTYRKTHGHHGPLAGLRAHIDFTPVKLHCLPHQGQAYPRAVVFRGVKEVERLLEDLRGHARPRVGDRDRDSVPLP